MRRKIEEMGYGDICQLESIALEDDDYSEKKYVDENRGVFLYGSSFPDSM